ncbi:MAG: hypothetical protein KTR31_38745 [Myxococcales bacterium]|nr:hypothetical protein [Myxococcales bacterium]
MNTPLLRWAVGPLLLTACGGDLPPVEIGRPAPERPGASVPPVELTSPEAPQLVAVEAVARQLCTWTAQGRAECQFRGYPLPSPPGLPFLQVVPSDEWSCGLTSPQGRVECWGEGRWLVEPPAGTFVDIAITPLAACALAEAPGPVECWGVGADIAFPEDAYVEIAGGGTGICARTAKNTVDCWSSVGHGMARHPDSVVALFDGEPGPWVLASTGELFGTATDEAPWAYLPEGSVPLAVAFDEGEICFVTPLEELVCTTAPPLPVEGVQDVTRFGKRWCALDSSSALLCWR